MLIVIVKQSNASFNDSVIINTPKKVCYLFRDSVPIKAYKNALIVADSLDRAKKEIATLQTLDSISDKIIDTLVKAIRIKEKQLQVSKDIYKDCTKLNELLAAKNESNVKAAKKELFWKRFFQFTTVAALTLVAIK